MAKAIEVFDGKDTEIDRLLPVFGHAGVGYRYSCVPLDWFGERHGWKERNALYVSHAVPLLERAAHEAIERSGLAFDDIDAVVTVSTTGIATPSLDALLLERLPLRRDVNRLPIFGLGCAGGVLGLARAAAMSRVLSERSTRGGHVLFMVVELCALTFRSDDRSKSNIVASALFGDGAAAAIIGPGHERDQAADGRQPTVVGAGEHTWPASLDVMGWRVEDDGFGVLFSRDIPSLVRQQFRGVLDQFLDRQQCRLDEIDAFVCHPGGAKVVSALEQAFDLPQGTLNTARDVLRDYGNMSAATVMFVLDRVLRPGIKRYLMSALGPGFSAGFVLLEAIGG